MISKSSTKISKLKRTLEDGKLCECRIQIRKVARVYRRKQFTIGGNGVYNQGFRSLRSEVYDPGACDSILQPSSVSSIANSSVARSSLAQRLIKIRGGGVHDFDGVGDQTRDLHVNKSAPYQLGYTFRCVFPLKPNS
ncbi:unnamed protein product [Lactuca saligna]|uniref:Uncharacterized protein n=1 Tax=Lactuca saligna TaxID=75948 RepID=A0AA35ZWN7_LACSI|nr:unnamed protein product [Lactuca saligna]